MVFLANVFVCIDIGHLWFTAFATGLFTTHFPMGAMSLFTYIIRVRHVFFFEATLETEY